MRQFGFLSWSHVRCVLAMLGAVFALASVAQTPAYAAQPALSCPAGTTAFDWDTPANTWTAGSLNNSYAVTALGSINFAITTTGGTWVTNASYGGTAPFRQNIDTYGFSPAQFTLQQWIDFSTRTQTATTVITLPNAVPGLQFSIMDIDFSSGGFTDRIVVTGSYLGSPVTPSLDTHNATPSYTISGNVAVGNAQSTATSMNGRVWVTFSAPVDTVTVVYGNAASAPTNPTAQAIDYHDISFCRPRANLAVSKISEVLDDYVSGANDKYLPGALIRYCITVNNSGPSAATAVSASDTVPADTLFVSGSMRSGTSCGTATTPEDDDASDGSEVDAVRMNFNGSVVAGTAATLAAGASIAMVFEAIVD